MHWKRWLTVIVILPPLILLILKGSQLLFTIVLASTACICLWEYFRIAYAGHRLPIPFTYKGWSYLSCAIVMLFAYYQNFFGMLMTLALSLLGAAAMSIFRFKTDQDAPLVAVKQIFGIFYIPFFLSFIVLLRAVEPNGPMWVLFLMWVIAWGDTGALYVGTLIGRHKLAPAVSPKKTIEGALGGLAANLVFAYLFKLLFFKSMNSTTCLAFALIVGMVGQVGDLFESEFKRAAGIKDSSTLLPGHGGFLDRLDALLLAAPVAYLLKVQLLP